MATITKEKMEELIRQKCAEYNITPDVLTPEELKELKGEIKTEQRGEAILDGVLFDPNILSRGK